MKNLEIALCDSCTDYILKFASFLMERSKVGVHIFTTPESFYSDENDYDIAIMSEEFKEIMSFRPKGLLKEKYFLCENQELEQDNYIFKYQSVEKIFNRIPGLRDAKASIKKSNEKSNVTAIYSPVTHELQLPFAMALCQSYRTYGKVLFIDLEEISILTSLIGSNNSFNLMDLLYEINTNSNAFDLSKYVQSFMGFDYVEPFTNPNEISEIDEDTWRDFFNALLKENYDQIIVLFGRTINGFSKFIDSFNKLYVLGKPGDYFKRAQEQFFDYLERLETNVDIEEVILPMSAGNLSDGAYHIEELLQGNLGVFVKKMMNANGKNEIKMCG